MLRTPLQMNNTLILSLKLLLYTMALKITIVLKILVLPPRTWLKSDKNQERRNEIQVYTLTMCFAFRRSNILWNDLVENNHTFWLRGVLRKFDCIYMLHRGEAPGKHVDKRLSVLCRESWSESKFHAIVSIKRVHLMVSEENHVCEFSGKERTYI